MSSAAPYLGRQLGTDDADREAMCAAIGVTDVEELLNQAVPASIRMAGTPRIAGPWSEAEVLAALREKAGRNKVTTSMIGMGFYDTHTPEVLSRNILCNPAWYTAYTPYQPEISQGRLHALLLFQTMIADLTGLPIAGASLLDESSAAAEAMALAIRVSKSDSPCFAVDTDVLPQTRAVLATRAQALGIELVDVDVADAQAMAALTTSDTPIDGALVQYPGVSGRIVDLQDIRAALPKTTLVVAADPLALTVLTSPGRAGADVCVGTTQRFGMPMGFGGPHAAYISVRKGLERQLPGRIVGISRDADGAPALRLALQTREQHIRREKATSNICTAQVLPAVMAAMYAVWHGAEGLRAIAMRVHELTQRLAAELEALGAELVHTSFVDTLRVRVPGQAGTLVTAARARSINIALVDEDHVGIALDETTTELHVRAVVAAFEQVIRECGDDSDGAPEPRSGVGSEQPGADRLTHHRGVDEEYLVHPDFHRYRDETSMMRFLHRLAGRDYALDRGMIPLGSCTMKLNPAVAMAPITWPGFARIHPFAPAEDVAGYRELIEELQSDLATLTGYAGASVQPNAGSQGELAGLLAIRAYHESRGLSERDVCLIPTSAHGTNAASAVLAGMRVVAVKCGEAGEVLLEDLRAKLADHAGRVAAIMITYPSTFGIYETEVEQVCGEVHAAGGQVYIDGANLNALAGIARPGDFGGDVTHLNLHKTFAIPHGGGGPGVGPVVAGEHLLPFLPGHPLAQWGRKDGAIAAAPFGSPSVLPISWAYLRLLGPEGFASVTSAAVLAANYLAVKLAEHYPVRYTGEHGRVAHECIVDVAAAVKGTDLGVDDVAKRLIDYGFHAPTMSFPIAGTFMVEPTEAESKAELDRFVAAMAAIAGEIEAVRAGEYPGDDNPLRGAPHTAACLVRRWKHRYSREVAVFPPGVDPADKYWPAVRRVDGAYGDRNLICIATQPDGEQLGDAGR